MTAASDTIFALASGRGGTIAVIRISGPDSGVIVDRLCHPRPKPRCAAYRAIHSADGEMIDKGLVLWFPGPASYTGEDCAEFQLHAGPAVVDAALGALSGCGARAAEPGEFTRRAFLFGRIDLVEAEGIADLIASETDDQRRQALAQSNGALSQVFAGWSDRVRRLLSLQEAAIDFPEEVGETEDRQATTEIAAMAQELEIHLEQSRSAERLRDGLTIVLAGEPNVGKSSLMNQLAGRDVAIVAPTPGTTRDRVEARILIEGVPVTLIDTAGLRQTSDLVEAEGVRRAREAFDAADLAVLVRTASTIEPGDLALNDRILLVINRVDEVPAPGGMLGVSATRGDNLDQLRERLGELVRRFAGRRDQPVSTRARHRTCVEETRSALLAAAAQPLPELRGEDLRRALRSLGRLTGLVGVEDVLDDIFSSFCIGK